MSSNSTADNLCASDDNLCIIREHQLEVIIVPTLLLLATLVTLLPLCLLRYCRKAGRTQVAAPQRHHSSKHRRTNTHDHRHHLQGIDAPPGINPLEHEELPMSVQTVQPNVKPTLAAVPQMSTERRPGAFSQVTALPPPFTIKPDNTGSLYRARMDNRNVVLRVLRETSNNGEKEHFLGFASFLSGLSAHPSVPALLGVVSVQSPLIIVVEELHHRDLLGFLWKCRQENSSCAMTEKMIFTMAEQVASALEYLHSKSYIHGKLGARSILVGRDLNAKLWGLGSAYRRRTQNGLQEPVKDTELRKWQSPEVLARRGISQSSDTYLLQLLHGAIQMDLSSVSSVRMSFAFFKFLLFFISIYLSYNSQWSESIRCRWSFGILLYEMVTLGDPPFAHVRTADLLQYLQRGKELRRPENCSSSLYSIIRSCCHWQPQKRISVAELIRVLQVGEKSANSRTVLRVPEPLNFEKYLREAGYGEAYNYAML